MKNKLLHPQKKHLIEHVSDSVKTLRGSDVDLQKTLLTGRAIKDVLGGDTISSSNVSDASYFEDGHLNLNLVIDASIRYIDVDNGSGSYVNGPLSGTANEKVGNAMFHTLAVLPSGSLSYQDLTDGKWTDEHGKSYPKSLRQVYYPDDRTDLDAYTRIGNLTAVENGIPSYIWSNWVSLSGRSLRILVTESVPGSAQEILSKLIPYSIYELHCGGNVIDLPSADDCILATSIAFEQYSNKNYTFSNVVEDAPKPGVAYYVEDESIPGKWVRAFSGGNEIYVLTNDVAPSAQTKYYVEDGSSASGYSLANGTGKVTNFVSGTEYFEKRYTEITQITSFVGGKDKYRTRDTLVEWTNAVRYTELVQSESNSLELVENTYTTTLVPGLDTSRISSNLQGSGFDATNDTSKWYEEANQAILYRFEVVDRERKLDGEYYINGSSDPQEFSSSKTWILDTAAEATDSLSGFVELLDSHTDQVVSDFIQYDKRHFKTTGLTGSDLESATLDNTNVDERLIQKGYNEALVVSQVVTSRGVAKISLSLNTNSGTAITDGFSFKVYKINELDEQYDPSKLVVSYVETTDTHTLNPVPNIYKKYYIYDPVTKFSPANGTGVIDQFEENVVYYEKILTVQGDMHAATCRINGVNRSCVFGAQGGDLTDGISGYPSVGRDGLLWRCLSNNYIKTEDAHVSGSDYSGTPNPDKNYYAKNLGSNETIATSPAAVDSADLADGTGHILSFDKNYAYYEMSSDYLKDGKIEAFIDVARNDTLIVVIESDNHFKDKKVVVPEITFHPDPHDSYVKEVDVNTRAFTTSKLSKESLPCNPEESIPSSEALKAAYETIVGAMQAKGLAFGNVPGIGNLDSIKSPGIYTLQPGYVLSSTVITQGGSDYDYLQHYASGNAPVFAGGTLVVFSNEAVASADRKLPLANKKSATNLVQLIFGWRTNNQITGEFWWRIGNGTTWSPWARLQKTPVIWDVGSASSVPAYDVAKRLRQGPLTVAFTAGSAEATVNLPPPANHKGDKMQVEAVNRAVRIMYSGYEYTNSTLKDRMLYPLECDGSNWYIITVS